MKKFIINMGVEISSYCLLCLLACAAWLDSSSLVGISVAAYWVIMFLLLLSGGYLLVLSYVIEDAKDEETKQRWIKLISDSTKKRNRVRRMQGWIFLILIVVLLAYSGWIFTAVVYVIVTLVVRFLLSLARGNIGDLKSEGLA